MPLYLVLYVAVTFRHSCLPVFAWRSVVLHFFDLKRLLRVSCMLWCCLSEYYSIILQNASFLNFSCNILKWNCLPLTGNLWFVLLHFFCLCYHFSVTFQDTDCYARFNPLCGLRLFKVCTPIYRTWDYLYIRQHDWM